MFPAAGPSGGGQLAKLAADEPEEIIGTAEYDVVRQRLEAVDAQLCHGVTVGHLGDEARKLIWLRFKNVRFGPKGIFFCRRTSLSPPPRMSIVHAWEFEMGGAPDRILAILNR